MSHKRREAVAQSLIELDVRAAERCDCLPLSSIQAVDSLDCEKVIPAPAELHASIRAQLATLFPRSTPLSLLLLHISQLEHIHFTAQSSVFHRPQRSHAPASFLEQVLVNVRRSLRSSDQLLIHEGIGAAIIFPEVDHQGVRNILERIYRNVSLLQAETVLPPLTRETDIVIGIGSYPQPAEVLEHLLYQVGVTACKLTLRPAITMQMWDMKLTHLDREEITNTPLQNGQDSTKSGRLVSTIPFMNLPGQLPTRLKQLIPYHIACELRCAPVGRDHHCLTVAMADPTDEAAICTLRERTGLTIFPVSCELPELDALLANKW